MHNIESVLRFAVGPLPGKLPEATFHLKYLCRPDVLEDAGLSVEDSHYGAVPSVQTPPVDEAGRSIRQTAPEWQAQAQVCLSFLTKEESIMLRRCPAHPEVSDPAPQGKPCCA